MAEVSEHVPSDGAGFVPTSEDIDSVLAWFAEWDGLAKQADVERMADMSLFPVNVVTDGEHGNGSAESWDREQFVRVMADVVGGASDLTMESVRTPHFLTESLVFVITNATITAAGHTQTVRYGDLLVKSDGQWVFQTMVQGGWG